MSDQDVYRRRIILCMDGTWEDPDSNTNVFRWFEHVNMSPHANKGEQWIQIPGYFKGVGITDGGQEDPLGAMTGLGIDQQILDAYQFLGNTIHDYERDEVWVIGFSRGAYAARSLVGMLYNVGMLAPHQMTPQNLQVAYEFYRHRSPKTTPESPEAFSFRKKYDCSNPHIRFLGCFDTVGSLGIPKLPFYLGGSILQRLFHRRYHFHDTNISPWVQSAFHAIAIHEQREWFQPVLMKYAETPYCEQELIQRWFPGFHQDVGGGVDDDARDASDYLLANKALQWMMTMGEERGMVFTRPINDICQGGKFVCNDSYSSSFIYRLMARKDRLIDPRVFGEQGIHAIYEDSRFSYLTKDELACYLSHTLEKYLEYLEARNGEAVKRKGNATKENLTWKINVLAAKVGEDTHIEQAKVAAFGKKQQTEPFQDDNVDQEKLLIELNQVKKKKLEAKLFHVRKEIKTGLKKSKTMETQKQLKKLREAQSSATSITSVSEESTENTADMVETTPKKGKVYTAEETERFAKELEIIKNLDVDPLIEKVLNNMIKKNATLKKDDMLSSLLANSAASAPITATSSTNISADSTGESIPSTGEDNKNLIANVEARLLGNKALTEPLKKSALEFEMLLLAPEQRKAKRKTITTEQRTPDKRLKPSTSTKPSSSVGSSSLFMESLGGDDQQQGNHGKTEGKSAQGKKDAASTDWEDPDFEKYYNGGAPEKQNRPGQRQRRMKWEAIHGNKAKHIVEHKGSVSDKRKLKQQNKHRQASLAPGKNDKKRPFNNSREASTKKTEENIEEFHPSWQAKRQQQEMMAKAFSGQGAGNKKIVFEDA